jgi:hypothetical protein
VSQPIRDRMTIVQELGRFHQYVRPMGHPTQVLHGCRWSISRPMRDKMTVVQELGRFHEYVLSVIQHRCCVVDVGH